jgi:hypothetical protein
MSDAKHIGTIARQIVQGHTNNALSAVGLLGSELDKLSELRFADCLLCDTQPHPKDASRKGPGLRDGKTCNQCGCNMLAKTKVKDATCPIGRW